jgi:hypothetical protein
MSAVAVRTALLGGSSGRGAGGRFENDQTYDEERIP